MNTRKTRHPGSSAFAVIFWSAALALAGIALPTAWSQEGAAKAKARSAEIERLRKLLASKDFDERANAADKLAEFGPAAKDVVPDLFRAVLDRSDVDLDNFGNPVIGNSVSSAGHALRKIAPPSLALQCLAEMKKLPEVDRLRMELASIMEEVYRPGDAVLDRALCDILKNPKDEMRVEIAHRILVKAPIPCAIPHLIEMLKDEREDHWNAAAVALAHYGPEASQAIPYLDRLGIVHKDVRPRWTGISAIAAVGRDSKDIAKFLRRVMKDKTNSQGIRFGAILGLRKSKFAESGMEDLIRIAEALEPNMDGQPALAAPALESISFLQPGATEVPRLLEIFSRLDKSQEHTAQCAAMALGKTGTEGAVAVPALLKAINNPILKTQPSLQKEYARALGNILGARSAADRLTQYLKSLDNPHPDTAVAISQMIDFLKADRPK